MFDELSKNDEFSSPQVLPFVVVKKPPNVYSGAIICIIYDRIG